MIELGNVRFCPFRFLPLRNIPSDCVNRDGLAGCVRDQLRIHLKYPSHADLCEHLDLVGHAWSPLELSIQHFGVCVETFLRHVAPKRPPNHLGRCKAQDALDRWVNGCKATLEVERGNDVIGIVHQHSIALFA